MAFKTTQIVVSGQSMTSALSTGGQSKSLMIEILKKAESVVLYRSSPSQKAEMVHLIKSITDQKQKTLAIGDGANDINMLIKAHIGIGLLG